LPLAASASQRSPVIARSAPRPIRFTFARGEVVGTKMRAGTPRRRAA
jgi:hypothetical protein